jgi:predicted RND superfamily exporter protein
LSTSKAFFSSFFEAGTRALLLVSFRLPRAVVWFWLLLAAASIWMLPRVQYDGSLHALLPPENPIVAAADALEGRMETTPSLAFIFDGEELDVLIQTAEELLLPFSGFFEGGMDGFVSDFGGADTGEEQGGLAIDGESGRAVTGEHLDGLAIDGESGRAVTGEHLDGLAIDGESGRVVTGEHLDGLAIDGESGRVVTGEDNEPTVNRGKNVIWLTDVEIDNSAPYLYRKALMLLVPEELKALIEGSQNLLAVSNPFFIDLEDDGVASAPEPGSVLHTHQEVFEYRSLHEYLQEVLALPPRFRTNPGGTVFVAEAFAGPALLEHGEEALLEQVLHRLDSLNTANSTTVQLFTNLGNWHHQQHLDMITRSVLKGSQISLLAVLLFLAGYLVYVVRRLRQHRAVSAGLVLALLGTVAGILLFTILITLGIAAAAGWTLNLFSVSLLGISFGVNADYLIHMLSARLDLHRRSTSRMMLLARLSSGTGKGMAFSLWTTGFAMVGLLFSEFTGFQSFGGLFLIALLVNYLLTFTLFMVIIDRIVGGASVVVHRRIQTPDTWGVGGENTASDADVAGNKAESTESSGSIMVPCEVFVAAEAGYTRFTGNVRDGKRLGKMGGINRAWLQVGVLILVGLIGLWSATRVSFSYSLMDLEPQKQQNRDFASRYAEAVDYLDSVEPSVLLLPDAGTAALAYETLLAHQHEGTAFTRVRRVESLAHRLTNDSLEVQLRVELIGELRELWNDYRGSLRVADDWPEHERAYLQQALSVTGAVVADSLPYRLRRLLHDTSGEPLHLIVIHPDNDLADTQNMVEFGADASVLVMEDGTEYVFVSSYLLTYAALLILKREVPVILMLAFLGMVLGAWMAFGRLVPALLASVSTLGGFVLTFAVLLPFGFELHLYNMLALPLLIGIGIDCGIHLIHAVQHSLQLGSPWRLIARGTLVYVTAASLTTVMGFFGFLWIDYPGLRDLAVLAITGTLCILVFSAVVANTVHLMVVRRG